MIKRRLFFSFLLLAAVLLLLKQVLKQSQTSEKPSEPTLGQTSPAPQALPEKAPEASTSASDTIYKILSVHQTLATFEGIEKKTCLGMTSLCPDKCGHSGDVAVFRINKYLRYLPLGKYGDPQQEKFFVMVKNTLGESETTEANREMIASLKKGDKVLLGWNHIYVTKEGASYPERPITVLKPLTPEESALEVQDFLVPEQ